ncbi:Centromere/kinetochore Zw10-domain-containing protein [Xylariomycetidae sp. FL2044]|nr:Centromere/kinetochore Zw10-domain-containing protein [Xylariomycetidae sp. FL2044]
MSAVDTQQIGQALVDFSLNGTFPEEDVSSSQIAGANLAPALESLAAAKTKLESEIHQINQETADDVNQWITNAKSLQDDINRTRSWANEIVRRSEAPDVSGKTIQEAQDKVEFLRKETTYNKQLYHTLQNIKKVNLVLDQVEQARDQRRILDSLHLLEKSWAALDDIPVSKSCRVMKLLDLRAYELKSSVHDVFDHVWNRLLQVDKASATVTVFSQLEGEQMSLADAVVGLKAYKEVDQRMALLWHSIDQALIGPRTTNRGQSLRSIVCDQSTLKLGSTVDPSISSLFDDLKTTFGYLSERLPEELVHCLSNVMMPDLIPRIMTVWLDSVVPASLKEMDGFQEVIDSVNSFCSSLRDLKFTGFEELQEWVDNTPRVWLSKCRESALDSIRSKLSQGLGDTREIERVETQTVSKAEGRNLAANGATPARDEDNWDAAWSDGGGEHKPGDDDKPKANEDDGTDAWGWGDDDEIAEAKPEETKSGSESQDPPEEDPVEAWGWGEEDPAIPTAVEEPSLKQDAPVAKADTRELTLKETYNISSMPEPVLSLISIILEDGASLVGSSNPMASAAAGLFSLPTLVLAMFRAVSPYYYSLDSGGNMFLYNDATYLSERLSDLASNWKAREDLAPRAISMLRLDNDIETLQSFAARAYAQEMSTQRTILRDLLGGSQNLLQQDGLGSTELESQVDGATGYVRTTAATWGKILSKSAWSQAIGSLVDTIASKLIADVMDLAGIGQDEAYNIANLIARVTELDDLFMPPNAAKDAVPATSEYAVSWLRLKYLSEVLQSNLQDVKYLWMESELSLYFTVDEVVDLIGLSFVDNARTRDVIREIQGRPNPLEG